MTAAPDGAGNQNRPSAKVSLSSIVEAWKKVTPSKPRSVAETITTMAALRVFLGHDDAARVTPGDILRWRNVIKEGGVTNTTWNNKLAMVARVLGRAADDGVLPSNPAGQSLRLDKNPSALCLPFSDDDARRILLACRKESRPSWRWAHWIMAFTGMRVAEVLQLSGAGVRQQDGIWIFDVNESDPERSVKTATRRNVSVHAALQAEGFIAYAQSIVPDSPLFPDKGLDAHGKRGGRGWQATGRWVREKVGIKDPRKSPNHVWRHRIEDEMRAAGVPEAMRDAIMGHARHTTGARYGIRGEALEQLREELAKVLADFINASRPDIEQQQQP
jgi:integrase